MANLTNKHPAPLSLLQIWLIIVVGLHVSNLGDPGVVQLILLGQVAHGWHGGSGHAAVAIVVHLGRDVLVEEADDDSGDDSGNGRDDGGVESPGEGVEDRPLHFLSELSHDHDALYCTLSSRLISHCSALLPQPAWSTWCCCFLHFPSELDSVCVCVCVCVCARMYAIMHVTMCYGVCVCVHTYISVYGGVGEFNFTWQSKSCSLF